MDPYRDPPPDSPVPPPPELDRLPVLVRGGVFRGGWIVVTPTELRYEPRLGRPRAVPIDAGIAGLRLSPLLETDEHTDDQPISTYETIYTWRQVTASPAYQRGLAARPNPRVFEHAFAHIEGDPPMRGTSFTPIIDGDRMVVLAGAMIDLCFELPENADLSDTTGRTLCRALRWLPFDALARMFKRVNTKHRRGDGAVRILPRHHLRAARDLTSEGRTYRVVGDPRDAVALELSAAEAVILDAWLAD